MLKLKIECHLKENGKYYNEILGSFKTMESASQWCESQSKGIFKYSISEGQGEVPREDSGRTTRRTRKGKPSTRSSSRKRRKT